MFSNSEAFGAGWRMLKERFGFLSGVHLVALAIQFAPQLLLGDSPGMKALVVIGSLLLSFVTALGLVRIGLNLVDGQVAGYPDLFSCAHLVFGYLVATFLHGALILLGCLLLVVPGLYLAAQFGLWPYLMVEHGMGPIEAMKESSRLTRGTRGKLMLFYVLILCAILAGVLALVVGAIVAYAVTTVAGAFVYRQILANQPDDAGAMI